MTYLSSRGNPRDVDGEAKAKLHGSKRFILEQHDKRKIMSTTGLFAVIVHTVFLDN